MGKLACPGCESDLLKSRYEPLQLAIVDLRWRWAVCCPGCGKTWHVAIGIKGIDPDRPLWAQAVNMGTLVVDDKPIEHEATWDQIDAERQRQRDEGMIR